MSDVVGGGHADSKVSSSQNKCAFALNGADGVKYFKNTIKMLLRIGKDKHKSTTRKYRTTKDVKTSAKKQTRSNIDILHDDCEQHMLNLSEEHGESYATRFIRDHN